MTAYLDKHQQLFRILLVGLATVMLGVSLTHFYRFTTSLTDENIFATVPGNLYVINPSQDPLSALKRQAGDGPRAGDIIIAVNDRVFTFTDDLNAFLESVPEGGSLRLRLFRSTLNKQITVEVPPESLTQEGIRKIPGSVYILTVLPGGASERAGLQVGDIIYRINGQNFNNALGADRIMRTAKQEKSIAYEILRGGEDVIIQMQLAKIGVQIWTLMFLFSGLAFIAVALFVGWERPQFIAARLLALTFLTMGYFACNAIGQNATQDSFTVFRQIGLLGAFLFAIPLWLHLSHYFPIDRPDLIARKWIRWAPYLVAAAAAIATIALPQVNLANPAAALLLIYTVLVLIIFRKAASEEYRKLNRPITVAVCGYLVIFLLTVILQAALGTRVSPGIIVGAYFISAVWLLLVPLTYMYTIGQYRLFDMDLRVRRNILYNIVSSTWFILIIAFVAIILIRISSLSFPLPNISFSWPLIEVRDSPLDPSTQMIAEKVILMALAILVTGFGLKLRAKGQKFLDHKFYQAGYDYSKAADEISEVLGTNFTLNSLSSGLVSRLASLIRVKQIGIQVYRDERLICAESVHGLEKDTWAEFCRRSDETFVSLIRTNRADYRFSVEYLPAALRDLFSQHEFRHIIAIRSKGKLAGALLIGEKLSESPLHKDDLVFLSSVSRQAGVAFENAFLYEELASQQRLKHELEIARRIQIASLPQSTPEINGLEIAGISIPAFEVGGDYYDYLNGLGSGQLTVIVGDVSGKGTSAAFYMSKMQGIMRSLHDFGLGPREIFIRANQLITEGLEKQSFITAVGAAFDPPSHHLSLARAGHLPLFHLRKGQSTVDIITPDGIGLGLTRTDIFATTLEELTIDYQIGDVFVFVTDGITEAQSQTGAEFGEEGLLSILEKVNGTSAKRIRDQIITAVNQFANGANQHDDLTVVVVKAT